MDEFLITHFVGVGNELSSHFLHTEGSFFINKLSLKVSDSFILIALVLRRNLCVRILIKCEEVKRKGSKEKDEDKKLEKFLQMTQRWVKRDDD